MPKPACNKANNIDRDICPGKSYNHLVDDKQKIRYMNQALLLARKGAGRVAPNPLVGALIVKSDQIIGKGYHHRFGGPHAEVEALDDCRAKGLDPRGATMFVTLEPCCHQGKTPPCTEAIIRAGIDQVIIAVLDEFPSVAGKGAQQLREKGIKIEIGCCEEPARRINAGFFKLQKLGRPLVILKWAQSIDGKLALPGPTTQRWISNEKSRRHVHQLRRACGAVLVGIGTVLADDPLLTARSGGKKPPQPLRVILDSNLRISLESKLMQSANHYPLLICCLTRSLQSQRQKVWEMIDLGCEVLGFAEKAGRVDLAAILTELGSRGISDLLVEGGPTILQSFWQEGLADKLMCYLAPLIIGDQNTPALHFAPPGTSLRDITIQQFDGDILIEGYLDR